MTYTNPYLSSGVYQPYQSHVPQSQPTPSIVWVQGEAGAKSYLVGAGQSMLLMDSESSTFYIKSTDASGMPMPLRAFDYTERAQAPVHTPAAQNQYVTHDELDKWTEDVLTKIKTMQEDKHNAKESTV